MKKIKSFWRFIHISNRMTKMKCLKIICIFSLSLLIIVAIISYFATENLGNEEQEKKPNNYRIYNNIVNNYFKSGQSDASTEEKSNNSEDPEDKFTYRVGKLYLTFDKKMHVELTSDVDRKKVKLQGELGMNIPEELGRPTFCQDSLHCLSWKSKIKLLIKRTSSKCHVFIWKSQLEDPLMDCYSYGEENWFGGPEHVNQVWPVEGLDLASYAYVPQENQFMAITERYWVLSNGVYMYVDEKAPLFIDTNYYRSNSMCFIAKDSPPYLPREGTIMKYTICQFNNPRQAHEHAIKTGVLKTPRDIPDTRMVRYPIWSTWVKFERDISQDRVLELADNITSYGFNHSQIEIDDNWETCYGIKEFNNISFPNVPAMTTKLKEKGFRTTLWTHPFVNAECPTYTDLAKKNYFVKNHKGGVKTKWWNGEVASVIDFTNTEAVDWFRKTHFRLLSETGIDGFKVDAGETSWLPQVSILNETYTKQPQAYTKCFAELAAEFGKLTEIRVGMGTQYLPIFVRMLDKDSKWDSDNGLPTLITTLLLMNMVGYNWVLPDMVGGNSYITPITKELFIRWLQATTFMPAIQFSAAPFDYDNETIEISKRFTALHYRYSDKIIELMNNTVKTGAPLNPPIWWVDPENPTAHQINSEYLLGEYVLVAPVLREGASKRDIYLPKGVWKDENMPRLTYRGRRWLRNYPADLNTLPYFTRISADDKNTPTEDEETNF